VDFLSALKLLLLKAHDRLVPRSDNSLTSADGNPSNSSNINGESNSSGSESTPLTPGGVAGGKPSNAIPAANNAASQAEVQNRRWLEEMDNGYRNLVNAIYPYIRELCELEAFLDNFK